MFKTGAICGTNSLRAFLNAGRSKSTIGDAEKNRASEMKKKMKGRPWVKDLGERRLDVRIPVGLWTMIYDQWWDEKDDIEHQTTPIAPICTLMQAEGGWKRWTERQCWFELYVPWKQIKKAYEWKSHVQIINITWVVVYQEIWYLLRFLHHGTPWFFTFLVM